MRWETKDGNLLLHGTVPDDFSKLHVSYYRVFSNRQAIPCRVFQQFFWVFTTKTDRRSSICNFLTQQVWSKKFQPCHSQKDLRGRNRHSVATAMYKKKTTRSVVESKVFWLHKGGYFMGKILLILLSNLLVLQKVVYLIWQNNDKQSPLSSFLVFSPSQLTVLAHPNRGYSKFIKCKEIRLKIRLVSIFKSSLLFQWSPPSIILHKLFYHNSNFELSIFIGSYKKQT